MVIYGATDKTGNAVLDLRRLCALELQNIVFDRSRLAVRNTASFKGLNPQDVPNKTNLW